jgi:ABC-type sugar transport system substrate-binding protein
MLGVLEALKAARRSPAVVTVGHEITEHTRNGLMDSNLTLVLAHPIPRLASEAIAQMRRDITTGLGLSKRLIGFDIYTPENI